MNRASLNLVVLRATDITRAAEFYSVFGMVFEKHAHGKGPEHFAAELGSTVFELYPQAGEDGSTRNVRIGFQVANADALLPQLEKLGARIVSPPKDSPWGRRAVIDDPFGHRVEITQAGQPAQTS